MNKSLALRNKIYRFCFLIFSFCLFIYVFYFLINGERGLISYYKIINKHTLMNEELIYLKNKNKKILDKISRLSPNTLDLEYLDEQLRLNTGRISENELIIILNN
jgi:cell division protein FtsB